MKNIIFLAPPAAGKGTFSEYLVDNYGYTHLSTGDLLREEAEENEELKEFLKSGKLVDDKLIIDLVEKKLKKLAKTQPFVLDGVPRTLQQAQKLDIILNGLGFLNVVAVLIDVEITTLVDRVVGRKVCPNCHKNYNTIIKEFQPRIDNVCDDCGATLITRSDDNLESFEVRYHEYEESVSPILAFYKAKGCLKVLYNNKVDQTEALKSLRSIVDEH